MTVAPGKHVVVVDGSNLATEGRTVPSLKQLDEAVRAYAEEDPSAEIVVVVDASFEHRIDPSERQQFNDAQLHGEVVSPPAGAIGRGDAFVLRIAERTGARVLSNDSFQEFHAEHPWLFDKGRLVGGKPVPGVGWIFTPRIPVRGPKSREATGKAKRKESEALSPPVKAAELAKAAKKQAARRALAPVLPDGAKPKVGDVWPAGAAGRARKKSEPADAQQSSPNPATKDEKPKARKKKAAEQPAAKKTTGVKAAATTVDLDGAADAGKAVGKAAGKKAGGKKAGASKKEVSKKEVSEKPSLVVAVKQAAKRAGEKALTSAAKAATLEKGAKKTQKAPAARPPAARAPASAPAKKAAKKKAPAKETPPEKSAAKSASRRQAARAAPGVPVDGTTAARATRPAAATNPAVQEAIGQALAEVIAPAPHAGDDGRGADKQKKQDGKGGRSRRRRSAAPPPAVNEPLAFITFVATYPLHSELEGEVVSFTSHGAMVDVDLPDGGVLHSYIPLTAMGDPAPTKARQVLTRGERRSFVLVALDPPRRVAELALPELVAAHGSNRE
jgi:hypothetical protein